MAEVTALSPDRPSTDPAQDLFGHAPFARTLADAIRSYREADGIVLALYGPWGAGKSTVLAYVQHELEAGPEEGRPVVAAFNPWWFSGQEHLAKAFLGQLQAVLPVKHKGFKKVGKLLGDFSSALGGAAEFAGKAIGISFVGKFVEAGFKLIGKPKDVPGLKRELSDLLLKEKKRVLVVIDDIDRLAPDEVRQLFTVIKALADFPYVTYLLAFDRDVAASAISAQTGLPGTRYLEKIVQVPFELPRSDRTALSHALVNRLNSIMRDVPEGRFDNIHWNNIFHSGLQQLILVPRDVIRLTNSLSVTYPAVSGEVNPVDFIAIEALRVFLPEVYDAIRTAPDEFVGQAIDGYNTAETRQRARAFHDTWLRGVPESVRESTKDMMERLFPRLESVWGGLSYGGDFVGAWRRNLRICAPEVFPTYFRLSLAQGAVSRADVDLLLMQMRDSDHFARQLEAAFLIKNAGGVSKVPELLDRLMDHVANDIPGDAAESVVEALFKVGDKLLSDKDRYESMFGFGNETRVARVVYHLLKVITLERRVPVLERAISVGGALRCGQSLIESLEEEAQKRERSNGESLVSLQDIQALKQSWCERVSELAGDPHFIDRPAIAWIVRGWREWGKSADAIAWWHAAAVDDIGLLKLIAAQASHSRTQSGSDLAWRAHLRVNPRGFEPYADIDALAERLRELLGKGDVSEEHAVAVNAYISAWARIRSGEEPDPFHFDEE
ncbi:KAP family P-loop domain protein [Lysobacter enzymogenes]|uniref:KAP family P-loop domain protein n=1 Tax=Lysobacter enzymogenes TaxID=69 RepID=A0A0S2DB20_LYSEN|nr:P-loop NTPase fold protein [Lysobacter enzymogenes]ALN55739.1 KAP family P-loop domain protein [Lysobacter enzymogenes]QCW24741.1 NTPase [Lysobacter enzymogenes]